MPAKTQSDSIRDMVEMLKSRSPGNSSAPRMSDKPFHEEVAPSEYMNTPVYEGDAKYPGGERGYTLTPPSGPPKRGSRASIAAAHQRRAGK
jgi:hypothetical protein